LAQYGRPIIAAPYRVAGRRPPIPEQETGERRTLLTAGFFRVDEKTVRTRSGALRPRQIVVHPPAAVILPMLDNERFLMIRNQRVAIDRELLELPAGKVDPGEDPAVCAARELEEETGYRAARIEPLCEFYPSPGILTEKMHAFVARDLHPSQQALEEGEQITVVETTLSQALEWIRERRIEDGKTLVTLMLYRLLHGGPQ
jgi:ADP-ribose pyrophosphatase